MANGEIELCIVSLTQMVTTPGIELVGPLPAEIQVYTVFAGAVSANSKFTDAAQAPFGFLKGPAAIPAIRAQDMEPL